MSTDFDPTATLALDFDRPANLATLALAADDVANVLREPDVAAALTAHLTLTEAMLIARLLWATGHPRAAHAIAETTAHTDDVVLVTLHQDDTGTTAVYHDDEDAYYQRHHNDTDPQALAQRLDLIPDPHNSAPHAYRSARHH